MFAFVCFCIMVKTASSVEGIYLVGPAGGKMRPWCGKCHKFLKSETADHDCAPVDFSKVRAAKKSGGSRPHKFRMTAKRDAMLKSLIQAGGIVKCIEGPLRQLQSAKSPAEMNKALKKMAKALGNKKRIASKASSLYKKFY